MSAQPEVVSGTGGAEDMLELLAYGPIGMGEGPGTVSAADWVQRIQDFAGRSIRIYINSPGGVVWDALSIYNALRRHPARKTVLIDGVCASAATIVAMAGNEIIAADNATIMVHPVWNQASGNAADLRREAKVLDDLTNTLIGLYSERTGQPREQVARWVAEETWLTAGEALAVGLIDRIVGAQRAAALWDFAAYGLTAPRAAAAAPRDEAGAMAARCEAALARLAEPVLRSAVGAALKAVREYIEGFSDGLRDSLTEFLAERLVDLPRAYGADYPDPVGDPEPGAADPGAGVPAEEESTSDAAPLDALLQRVRQIHIPA